MSVLISIFATAALATAGTAAAETPAASVSSSPVSAPETNPRYERVAEVLISEKICRVFGYSVDAVGLANWANGQSQLIAQNSDDVELADVHRRMTDSIQSHYWFVRTRYQFAFARPSAGSFYNTRRFQMRYREKCGEIARSSDAGPFFTKTSDEADYADMIQDVRVNFMRLDIPRVRRAGKRAPVGDVRIKQ